MFQCPLIQNNVFLLGTFQTSRGCQSTTQNFCTCILLTLTCSQSALYFNFGNCSCVYVYLGKEIEAQSRCVSYHVLLWIAISGLSALFFFFLSLFLSFLPCFLHSIYLSTYHHLTRYHVSVCTLRVKRILWCFQSLFQPLWVRNYLQPSDYKLWLLSLSGFWGSLDSVCFSSIFWYQGHILKFVALHVSLSF